jgi:DNA-binding MarR family transcriptional regulator
MTSRYETMQRDHIDRFLEQLGNPPELSLDLETEGIVDRVNVINKRMKREMEATLAEHGLSHGEWQVLANLYHGGEPYCSSPGELSAELELSSGAMTNRIDRLEKRGYVRRHPDPEDRRGVQVELTPEGRQAWEASAATQGRKEALIASVLSEREKTQLNGLLRKLVLALETREA